MEARIIDFGAHGEARLLREILESLGAQVRLDQIGNPHAFLDTLNDGFSADFSILSGHGKNGGLWFGEYGEGVDTSPLKHGVLPADQISGRLSGTVVSTACETGNSAWANVILGIGASSYIAPKGFPDGAAMAAILHALFFGLLHQNLPLSRALDRAQTHHSMGDALALFTKR